MRGKIKDKVIKIVLSIVVIVLAASFLGNYIQSHNIKTITIPAEEVYVTYDGYGFVCADEYLLTATANGKINPVINEGERVAKNYAVYAVQSIDSEGNEIGNAQYFYAPLAGLVSYKIDGYESIDDIEQITALNLEEIYIANNQSKSTLEAINGQACAKIINNIKGLRLVCILPQNDYTQNLAEDTTVRVVLPELDFTASGSISALSTSGDNAVIDLKVGGAHDSLYLNRVVKVQFGEYVKQEIALPQTAILYRNGEAGVYALSKGFVYWRAVELKDVDIDGNVIVEGLSENDEIVADAQRVKEGMYIH